MMRVGVRALKAHLSRYLRKAAAGERILVTDRGVPVATLAPATQGAAETRLQEMVRAGVAVWAGGVPRGTAHPPKVRGRAVAEAVVEDRR
jgi:prevent-host-death family protein